MNTRSVPRDERTTMVENASYRWGYLVLSFGLLLSVAYRSFIQQQTSWDLLALVLLSGVVTTLYQRMHHVLSRRWTLVVVLTTLVAAVISATFLLMQ